MSKNLSKSTIISPQVLQTLKSNFNKFDNTPFCFVEISHRSKNYANLNVETTETIKQRLCAEQYQCFLMPSGTAIASFYYNLILSHAGHTEVIFYTQGEFSLKFYKQMKKYYHEVTLIDNPESLKKRINQLNEKQDSPQILLHYNQIQDGFLTTLPQIEKKNLQKCLIIKNINFCLNQECSATNQSILYFETQTGFSIPGFTVLLIKKNVLKSLDHVENCPDMFGYEQMLKMKSIVNTPFTLCTYVLLFNVRNSMENAEYMRSIIQINKKNIKSFMDRISNHHSRSQQKKQEANSFLSIYIEGCDRQIVQVLKKLGFYQDKNKSVSFFIQAGNTSTSQLQKDISEILQLETSQI